MVIYAINGSPRKKWNTATILQNVLEGAAQARQDVQTELVNLYDLRYKGCVECFECKRIGGPSYGKCAVKDDIHELLQKVLHADAAVFGSPIFFSEMTGMLRCFMERLLFPAFVYDKNHTSIAPKRFPIAFVYTMNVPAEAMATYKYPQQLRPMESFAAHIFGHEPKLLYLNNTYQFSDYKKYECSVFSEEEKAAYREKHFPIDCENARSLGAELVQN